MGQISPHNGDANASQAAPSADQLRAPTGPAASMIQLPPPEIQHLQAPWVFRGCWFAVLVMHVVIGLAYMAMAMLFAYIKANVNVLEAMSYLGHSLIDYFPAVIGVGIVSAVLHGLAVLYILFWTLRFRTLLFSQPELDTAAGASAAPAQTQTQGSVRFWTRLCSTRDAAPAAGGTAQAHNRRKLSVFGLKTHDLELLVDISLQTFQAEKISRLITRVWINRLVALVIVCNCWFAPLVRVVFRRHHRATIDVIQLVVDSVLDIVYAVAIPAAILFPYYNEFDVKAQTFPFINYYKDAWYINAVAENQQFFVTSWIDFISKMLPGFSLLLRLHQIKRILMRHKQFGVKGVKPSMPGDGPTGGAGSRGAGAATQSTRFRDKTPKAKRKVVARWVYSGVLLGWGVAILAIHLHATTVAYYHSDPGCLLELRPWAATKYVCVVLEVSCTQRGIAGERGKVAEALAAVDVREIKGLVLSHCPALDVPPQLQQATKLQLLKVHNSTVAAWGADAALTATAHPHMQLLYVTRTNMNGALPPGLLARDFPPSLYDVELCATDLLSLPIDLDERWPSVQYLLLELSPGITAPPSALARMPGIIWLSLSGNAIRHIPNSLFAGAAMYNLMIGSNPLQALPATLGDLSSTTVVVATDTNITKIPSSLLAAAGSGVNLYLHGSPLCNGSSDARYDAGPFRVSCEAGYTTHFYPLDWEDYWRKQNRFP